MLKGLDKFNELIVSLSNLPTIGKKTAIRLAYFLCMTDSVSGMKLAHNIENAIRFIKPCLKCGFISENELCEICSDENRDKALLCIVQNPKDVLTIEESKSYQGLYFVFGDLNEDNIEKLRFFIKENRCKELIFALTHNIHSDAIIFFLEDKLKDLSLKFSKIAQGIPNGVHLENVDSVSLNQAINFRIQIN